MCYHAQEMKFTKMHGCGNDYVYVDAAREKVADPAKLAVAISDRHFGVGSDGLILIAPSKKADFRMIMFNNDGSEGLMCGNGIRCIGKYAFDHQLTKKKKLTIETKGGIVALDLHVRGGTVETVTVDMGAPRPVPLSFHIHADGESPLLREKVEGFDAFVLSMGNPHCVIPVGEDPYGAFPFETLGPKIEKHPDFPSKVNVEFVRKLGPDRLQQRTWERGSGETFACGSGACAVAAAHILTGATGRKVAVELRGGTLEIEMAPDGRVLMTGPAVEVFSGEWPTASRRSR